MTGPLELLARVSPADAVNGLFELSGGFFILLSVRRLLRNRIVRGISWVTTAFFMAWGYWNLYFYPSLDQWISLAGGVFIVAANTLWVVLLVYYTMQERGRRGTSG